MIKTIIIAIITYLATSLDEIPVLFMLYRNTSNKGRGRTITLSYFIGTFFLVAIGLLGAFGLVLIPVKWAVGFIGFIPIIMGIKVFIDGDDDEEKAMAATQKFKALWVKVFALTIALGADDFGVYVPLFTTLSSWEIVQMLFVFAVGTLLLCLISFRLTQIKPLNSFIENRERYIVSIVFIVIGAMVIYECGTIPGIIGLFS
jgi:cadmium resistance transport/sequestration family protein